MDGDSKSPFLIRLVPVGEHAARTAARLELLKDDVECEEELREDVEEHALPTF